MKEKNKQSNPSRKLRTVAIIFGTLALLFVGIRFFVFQQMNQLILQTMPNVIVPDLDYASLRTCTSENPLGIIYGTMDGEIEILNLQTQELTTTNLAFDDLTYRIDLSVDVSPQNDAVVFFDTALFSSYHTAFGRLPLSDHHSFNANINHQLLWSPQGTWLYTNRLGEQRGLYLINPATGFYETIENGNVFRLIWSEDERYLAFLKDIGAKIHVIVYDTNVKDFPLSQRYEYDEIATEFYEEPIAFMDNNLLIQSESGIERFNLETGASESILTGISVADFSPNGHWMLRLDTFYDLRNAEEFSLGRVGTGNWSPDSRHYAWLQEGRVFYFDVESQQISSLDFPYPYEFSQPEWSPNSQYLTVRYDYDQEQYKYHYYNYVISLATGAIKIFRGTTIIVASERDLMLDVTSESYAPIWSPDSVFIPYIVDDFDATFSSTTRSLMNTVKWIIS